MQQMVSADAKVLRVRPLEETYSGVVRRRDGSNRIYYASANPKETKAQDGRTHLYPVMSDGKVSRVEEIAIEFPRQPVDIIDPASVGITGKIVWTEE